MRSLNRSAQLGILIMLLNPSSRMADCAFGTVKWQWDPFTAYKFLLPKIYDTNVTKSYFRGGMFFFIEGPSPLVGKVLAVMSRGAIRSRSLAEIAGGRCYSHAICGTIPRERKPGLLDAASTADWARALTLDLNKDLINIPAGLRR